MNIFVGSLPYRYQEGDLSALFSNYGEVTTARIIKDHNTGRSKGYGFVEMPDEAAAQRAINELNGSEVMGRSIVVNVAQERAPRDGGNRRSGYGDR
ncbi:MAG: RNA recognition motif domain-containing protein [Bacteroides sp.]|jgi:RNA-binding protein